MAVYRNYIGCLVWENYPCASETGDSADSNEPATDSFVRPADAAMLLKRYVSHVLCTFMINIEAQ